MEQSIMNSQLVEGLAKVGQQIVLDPQVQRATKDFICKGGGAAAIGTAVAQTLPGKAAVSLWGGVKSAGIWLWAHPAVLITAAVVVGGAIAIAALKDD